MIYYIIHYHIFIQPYLYSDKEFEKRFGIVMLLHYIDEEYIDRLLKRGLFFIDEKLKSSSQKVVI